MAPKLATLDVGDEFEGRKITKAEIKVTNAGDGLSQAVKIDPLSLHQGDTVYVVLECQVGRIAFEPYADEVCARVQTLRAGVATIIDKDAVATAIDAQREKNRLAADAAAGRQDFLKLAEDHEAGLHDTPAPGCPACAPLAPENPDGSTAEPESIKGRKGRPRGAATGDGDK